MWDVFGCQLAAFVSYRKALSILLSEFSKHLRHFADAVIQSVSRCCSVFMIKTKPSDKLKSDIWQQSDHISDEQTRRAGAATGSKVF